MEHQHQHPNNSNYATAERSSETTVRTRWAPRPEQVLILESIFDGGMVNPPRDETVRIRKLLERFGAVADANVFYWFQNRRSRSRRRQRQMQASVAEAAQPSTGSSGGGGAAQFESSSSAPGFVPSFSSCPSSSSGGDGSGGLVGYYSNVGDLSSFSGQLGNPEIQQSSTNASIFADSYTSNSVNSNFSPSNTTNLHYPGPSGLVTVFINGVQTEVRRGPLDSRAFGEDVLLLHSSGLPVPFNEFGYSTDCLEHGESYFLVSRPT